MRNAIGDELVKWNATRFGTNYIFLDSIYRKRDRFMPWMASSEFQHSKWADTEDDRFTHARFSSMEWCEGLKYIIDTVQPIYKFLRFADHDKRPNMCEVVMAYQNMRQNLASFFGNNVSTRTEYLSVVEGRMRDVFIGTYVGPGTTIRCIYFEALLTLCLFKVIYILQLLS